MSALTFRGYKAAAFTCAALILSGCGGDKKDTPSAPQPAPPPTAAACTPIRAIPAADTVEIQLNSQLAVMYKAGDRKRCETPVLMSSFGATLSTTVVLHHEWQSPDGGVVGTYVMRPSVDMAPSSQYQIMLGGKEIAKFRTAVGTARRGEFVSAPEQNLTFGKLPQTSLLAPDAINALLHRLADSMVKEDVLADAVYELIRLEAPNAASPKARYAARIRKLTYTSSGPDGTAVTLSGLLVYPENADATPFDYSKSKLVLSHHGSIDAGSPAPSSAATVEVLLGAIAAGKGHIFFVPDLIGLGESANRPQAYLVAHDTATASQDMLSAVRHYFKTQHAGTVLGTQLVISGASQGAYSALATLPYVSSEYNVTGVYGLAGPYNIYQTFTSSVLAAKDPNKRDNYGEFENVAFVPGHVHSILQSYKDTQRLNYVASEVLNSEGGWQSAFLANYSANKYPDWTQHLGLNTLLNSDIAYSAPNATVALFHYTGDTLVPSQNTTDLVASLQDARHRFAKVDRASCHEGSLFTKALLEFKKAPTASHLVCGIYYVDRIIGDL